MNKEMTFTVKELQNLKAKIDWHCPNYITWWISNVYIPGLREQGALRWS